MLQKLPRIALLAVFASAVAAASTPPVVDGDIAPEEWSGARRETLVGGGEVLVLRAGSDLYVAVKGAGNGFPSLCVGDANRVDVMHASAALGTVTYKRTKDGWSRGNPFEWRVRDLPEPSPTLQGERDAFFKDFKWLANASRTGAPAREFKIRLDGERVFLGVVFLSTDTMQAAYWPASMDDGCRELDLLRGEAPGSLALEPSRWHPIE